jgi:hypothetical protein
MNLKRFAVLGVVVLLGMLSGCPSGPGPNPGPDVPPGPDSRFEKPCADFCQHLRALKCKEGEPLPNGKSCETFCIDTQKEGHNLNIPCILQIQSCAEQERCR